MPAPALPFWMRQRQIKAEPLGEPGDLGEPVLKLTMPNLPAHELCLQGSAPRFKVVLRRLGSEGAKEVLAEREFEVDRPEQAWLNAYELFRQQIVI
jgi:hypothetical protein